jgi:phosphate transport system substrate-binding protein
MPMIVIVPKDSPLSRLTMRQLDGIFGEQRDGGYEGQYWRRDRARGPEGNIRTWGQLGVTGAWADKPIAVYGYDVLRDNFALYFAARVLHGGDKWTPSLHEFAFSMTHGEMGIDGLSHVKGSAPIVEAVARDPYGIGYCTSRDWTPAVRAVALSESDGGPYVEPTREHVADRSYPLSRLIYWIFLHPAGKPVDPKVREFLRYVLSKKGQTDVLDERCYLPLTPSLAAAESRKLD